MIIKSIIKKVEISKAGNPYARVIVKFDEYKDGKGNLKWISGFGNKLTWKWNIGDDVQPEITENGNYLNFSFGDEDENRLNVHNLPATVGWTMDYIKSIMGGNVTKTQKNTTQNESTDREDNEPNPF